MDSSSWGSRSSRRGSRGSSSWGGRRGSRGSSSWGSRRAARAVWTIAVGAAERTAGAVAVGAAGGSQKGQQGAVAVGAAEGEAGAVAVGAAEGAAEGAVWPVAVGAAEREAAGTVYSMQLQQHHKHIGNGIASGCNITSVTVACTPDIVSSFPEFFPSSVCSLFRVSYAAIARVRGLYKYISTLRATSYGRSNPSDMIGCRFRFEFLLSNCFPQPVSLFDDILLNIDG